MHYATNILLLCIMPGHENASLGVYILPLFVSNEWPRTYLIGPLSCWEPMGDPKASILPGSEEAGISLHKLITKYWSMVDVICAIIVTTSNGS